MTSIKRLKPAVERLIEHPDTVPTISTVPDEEATTIPCEPPPQVTRYQVRFKLLLNEINGTGMVTKGAGEFESIHLKRDKGPGILKCEYTAPFEVEGVVIGFRKYVYYVDEVTADVLTDRTEITNEDFSGMMTDAQMNARFPLLGWSDVFDRITKIINSEEED